MMPSPEKEFLPASNPLSYVRPLHGQSLDKTALLDPSEEIFVDEFLAKEGVDMEKSSKIIKGMAALLFQAAGEKPDESNGGIMGVRKQCAFTRRRKIQHQRRALRKVEEHCGQLVQDPLKRNDVESLFEQARRAGAKDGTLDQHIKLFTKQKLIKLIIETFIIDN
ncbi:hypothetical protein Tco_0693894 [Tanacetum coccineum]